MSKWKNVRTYLEVNPYTGQPVEEDAPTNAVDEVQLLVSVLVQMVVGFDPKKKKKKTLIDARSKAYREHRMRLEREKNKLVKEEKREKVNLHKRSQRT